MVGPVRPLAVLEAHIVQLGRTGAGVVHVEPGAVKTRLAEGLGVGGPPVTPFGNGVIRKPGTAGPHKAYIGLALRVLAKDVGGLAASGYLIPCFYFHTGVQYRNDAAAIRLQTCQVGLQIAKVRGVGGEDLVVVHVVNIQPQAVIGEGVLCESHVQLGELLGARITPAALVVAERPQRRQRRGADQALQALSDSGGTVTRNHIKRGHAVVGPHPESGWRVLVVFAKEEPVGAGVHKHRARVVHKNAHPARALAHQQVGNSRVLRVGGTVLNGVHGVVCPYIGVPKLGALAGLFHAGHLLTLAKETHVCRAGPLHQPGAAADADGCALNPAQHDLTLCVGQLQTARC